MKATTFCNETFHYALYSISAKYLLLHRARTDIINQFFVESLLSLSLYVNIKNIWGL